MSLRPATRPRILPRLISAFAVSTALTLASVAAAPAQAQTIALEKLSFGPKEMTFSVPQILVEGSTLTQDELKSLLAPKDVKSAVDLLARFNAKSIRVPEIRLEQDLPVGKDKGIKQTAIYRDLVLTDIVAGKAKSASVASTTISQNNPELGQLEGTAGRGSVEDLDFTAILRLAIETGTGTEAPKTLYRNGVFDGMSMKGKDFEFTMGRASFGDIRARPFRTSIVEVIALAKELEKSEEPPTDTATLDKLIDFGTDLFEGIEMSPATVEGLRITGPEKKGNGLITVSADKFSVGAFGKGRYPAYSADNIQIKGPDGFAKIGQVNFKGIDFSQTLALLKETKGKPLDEWSFIANMRLLIPSFEGFAISGVDFDFPDEKKGKDQRIKFKLASFDLTLGSYVGGIPTNISTELKNFVMDVPAASEDKNFREMREAGYKVLDFSTGLKAKWNEATKTIALDSVRLDSAGMGSVELKGNLGNVTKELFTGDQSTMMIAAMALTAKDVGIKISNTGVFEKVIALKAKEQNKKPADLQREMAAMVKMVIPATLGDNPASKAVADAVSAFVNKPGNLELNAKAKNAEGVSAMELMMAGNPMKLLPKVDLSARAN